MLTVIHSFGFSGWHFSTLFDASLLELKATFLRGFFLAPILLRNRQKRNSRHVLTGNEAGFIFRLPGA